MKEKLCLALDVPNIDEAKKIVNELKDYVGVFKVGKELFTAEGPKVFEMIKDAGGEVFADMKYHDIPNTVASAAKVLVNKGVKIFNVHATGGMEMIKQTRAAIDTESKRIGVERPILLAVTVLTSLNNEDLEMLKIDSTTQDYVLTLAKIAKEAGADGVVCSAQEIEIIKSNMGSDFITLTPGIRPNWSVKGDQKRVMTPKDAVKKGTDYIVVGRPITKSENMVESAKRILEEMGE